MTSHYSLKTHLRADGVDFDRALKQAVGVGVLIQHDHVATNVCRAEMTAFMTGLGFGMCLQHNCCVRVFKPRIEQHLAERICIGARMCDGGIVCGLINHKDISGVWNTFWKGCLRNEVIVFRKRASLHARHATACTVKQSGVIKWVRGKQDLKVTGRAAIKMYTACVNVEPDGQVTTAGRTH